MHIASTGYREGDVRSIQIVYHVRLIVANSYFAVSCNIYRFSMCHARTHSGPG